MEVVKLSVTRMPMGYQPCAMTDSMKIWHFREIHSMRESAEKRLKEVFTPEQARKEGFKVEWL